MVYPVQMYRDGENERMTNKPTANDCRKTFMKGQTGLMDERSAGQKPALLIQWIERVPSTNSYVECHVVRMYAVLSHD